MVFKQSHVLGSTDYIIVKIHMNPTLVTKQSLYNVCVRTTQTVHTYTVDATQNRGHVETSPLVAMPYQCLLQYTGLLNKPVLILTKKGLILPALYQQNFHGPASIPCLSYMVRPKTKTAILRK